MTKIVNFLRKGFSPEEIRRREKIPKRLWDIWEQKEVFSIPAGEEESKDTQVAMSIKKEEVPSNPEDPQGSPKRFKTKAEWMYYQPWYKPLARHKKEFPYVLFFLPVNT